MFIKILSAEATEAYNDELLCFEKQFAYTANDQMFSISHGAHYGRFFQSLRWNKEAPWFCLARDESGTIVGLVVVVLQVIPPYNDTVWYMGDLKIAPSHRSLLSLHVLLKPLKERFLPICHKVYALSMNPACGRNRVAFWATHNRMLPLQVAKTMDIDVVSKDTISHSTNGLTAYRSTETKTIIMNHHVVDLWHISTRSDSVPLETVTLGDHSLVLTTTPMPGSCPWGSCTVMHTGLDNNPWDWIETSDI